MNTASIDYKLREHHIRPTDIRRSVLNILQQTGFALSHAEIARELSETFDRVTIYRTLNNFIQKGLIHKVVDESNTAKFALCKSEGCNAQTHDDEHVHFKCQKCGHTFCLNSLKVTLPNLPPGYQYNGFRITVEGICRNCSANQ